MSAPDIIIVGAGLAGAVSAERLADKGGRRILVIEKRTHIAGNLYDELDEHGILIHRYGPHIFHTKSQDVWNYLRGFSEFSDYQHRVLGAVDGALIPVPFNLESLHTLLPPKVAARLEGLLLARHGIGSRVSVLRLMDDEEEELRRLGRFVFAKVFEGYSRKQWGSDPYKLPAPVLRRVPISISYKSGYFTDPYQGLPRDGYTALINRLLSSEAIEVQTGVEGDSILEVDADRGVIYFRGRVFHGHVIFTGMVDALFNFQFGELPYRTLDFLFHFFPERTIQQVGTVNYLDSEDFTRVTEFKHLTGQITPHTVSVTEYPRDFNPHDREDIPYYPMPGEEHRIVYERYKALASRVPKLVLLGRLAEYTYYDMDAVVAKALRVHRRRFME